MFNKRKLILVDLDGTLCTHHVNQEEYNKPDIFLPGALEQLIKWRTEDCYVVLTTARTLEQVQNTLTYLKDAIGFEFDQMLLDIPTGERWLFNDKDYEGNIKAFAMNLDRNKGWLNE